MWQIDEINFHMIFTTPRNLMIDTIDIHNCNDLAYLRDYFLKSC